MFPTMRSAHWTWTSSATSRMPPAGKSPAMPAGRIRLASLPRRQQPFGRDEDQQSNQAADQRAVDADVLQVLADLQLEAVDQGRGVPGLHHIGDEGADLGA